MQIPFNFGSVNINSEIKVIRVSGSLAIDKYKADLKRLVELSNDYYPGIDIWFEKKVIKGLKENERFAYIVYSGGEPIGSAIIKKGSYTKLCSLRIAPEYRMNGLGHLLMSLLGREVRVYAGKLYFTAPLSVYEESKPFFKELGYELLGSSKKQYRLFEEEISCSVKANVFWKNIVGNLPELFDKFTLVGNPTHPDIVISIRPEYADKIKKKEKKIEIRRKFNKKWKGAYAMLYASGNHKQFFGEAKIYDVIEDSPDEIWRNYHSEIGVEKSDFDKYCIGTDKICALILSEVEIYKAAIYKQQVEQLLEKEIVAPQSYCSIKEGTRWPTAVMLNHLIRATQHLDIASTY